MGSIKNKRYRHRDRHVYTKKKTPGKNYTTAQYLLHTPIVAVFVRPFAPTPIDNHCYCRNTIMIVFPLFCKLLLLSSCFQHQLFQFFTPPLASAPLRLDKCRFGHNWNTQHTHGLLQLAVSPSCHHLTPHCC